MMSDARSRKSLGGLCFWTRLGTLSVAISLGAFAGWFAVGGAGQPVPARPPIVGVANIGLKTDNLAAAREYYTHILGYQEALTLNNPTGDVRMTYFKVNDHQYIELSPNLTSPTEDRLLHVAFETTDARALRDYLAARGVAVPDTLKPGLDGNLSFIVKDPDGHSVEFVQYLSKSRLGRNFGKFLPDTRISQRIIHVGVTVADRAAADRFYKDILGFQLGWYGGMAEGRLDWVVMHVPDGTDWLEYMLNSQNPTPERLGAMHHLSLGVPSINVAYKTVMERGYKPDPPKIGLDGKWQLNLYDPNHTRSELMEFKPVREPRQFPLPGQ